MNIIFLLIACSIILALAFLLVFLWSVRSGQYDDTYTPSVRVLFDETPASDAQDLTKPDQVGAEV